MIAATTIDVIAGVKPFSPLVLLAFAAATMVIEFFDISLPRGDSVGVSGAVNCAALVILGPIPALLSAGIGVLVAFAARPKKIRSMSLRVEMPALFGGFLLSSLVYRGMQSGIGPLHSYALILGVSVSYLLTELVVLQFLMSRVSRRSAVRLIRANIHRQLPLLATQVSVCLLTVVIYPTMQVWSLLLVVVLLLLIRQSYALLLETRDTYRTTVEVLVEAAEKTDYRLSGHAERTSEIAREIGALCGVSPSQLERLSYAALLHDIEAISSETNAPLTKPSVVLSGLEMFSDVVPILRVFESGVLAGGANIGDCLLAFVVAISSDIDVRNNQGLSELHVSNECARLSVSVPATVKARVAAAALKLGYGVPAIR